VIDLSYQNRFGGVERLYGAGSLERLRCSHVAVVGLGGVGSWAVEALARTGVGSLTLVDLDDVCATNTNRQLHALDPEWGRLKVEVLAERVHRINPEAVVTAVPDFFTLKSAPTLLGVAPDVVIDAIDTIADKVALVRACRGRPVELVLSGGAGGRTDPTRVKSADLGRERGDALLKSLKRALKLEGFLPDDEGLWGLECVYSDEPPVLPWELGSGRIDCATGFGAAAFVTGAFGLALASRAVRLILALPARLT